MIDNTDEFVKNPLFPHSRAGEREMKMSTQKILILIDSPLHENGFLYKFRQDIVEVCFYGFDKD